MVLFKRPLLFLVLKRRKTQTRRIHKRELTEGRIYPITDRWFSKPKGYIKITRKYRQRLADITLEEIQKEGFNTLEEFKAAWIKINGSWNPDQTVIVYEFKLVKRGIPRPPRCQRGDHSKLIYPPSN